MIFLRYGHESALMRFSFLLTVRFCTHANFGLETNLSKGRFTRGFPAVLNKRRAFLTRFKQCVEGRTWPPTLPLGHMSWMRSCPGRKFCVSSVAVFIRALLSGAGICYPGGATGVAGCREMALRRV